MARHYEETYGVPSTAVIASIDPALAQAPPPELLGDDSVVIGMVGQFYASEEWAQLITALKIAKWRVGERKVILMTFGHERPPAEIPEINIDDWDHNAEGCMSTNPFIAGDPITEWANNNPGKLPDARADMAAYHQVIRDFLAKNQGRF